MSPYKYPRLHNENFKSHFHLKFFDSTIAAIAVICFISNLFAAFPYLNLDEYNIPIYIFIKEPSWWLLTVVFGIAYSLYWKHIEKDGDCPSSLKHAQFRGIIRLVLVYLLSYYGFSKLLGNQFQTYIYQQDLVVRDLDGFLLTWIYFSHSSAFGLFLGIVQITGAALLLFNRTTLLGAFILLPVMINIVLINVFYDITRGALINSLVITVGLIYLLLLHYNKLKELLFQPVSFLPKTQGTFTKHILPILVVALGFLNVYQYHLPYIDQKLFGTVDTTLTGKWKVERQFVNGIQVQDCAWETDASIGVWSNIYFEERFCAITSNPYYYDQKRGKKGRYTYDAGTGILEIMLGTRKEDNFKGIVESIIGDKMMISGIYNGDLMALELAKKIKN